MRSPGRLGRLAHWLQLRSPHYVLIRLASLLRRYGITPGRAQRRVVECVDFLALHGCHPTFPTPGRVVDRYTPFLRALQEKGAEIAVHGYDHVDFRSLSASEAREQFARATDAFRRGGLQTDGFRCPYLSYTDALLDVIPGDSMKYSSNKAIWWDVVPQDATGGATAIFDSLSRFYHADPAGASIATPRLARNVVEIPVAVPDDIQLYDGLKLGEEGMLRAWGELLRQTHRRGELFVLLFHPELFHLCRAALASVLTAAKELAPAVWVTQLRDVSRWWWERSGFRATISAEGSGLRVDLSCSERATVLARGIAAGARTHGWDGAYEVLEDRALHLPAGQRPFVGVAPDLPEPTRALIAEQGFIVDDSPEAQRCTAYLDAAALAGLANPVQLIAYIESAAGPLVRFWRWPDEAKSALCITGDLDALSLLDYASRLFRG